MRLGKGVEHRCDEGAGGVSPGEKEAQVGSHHSPKYPRGGCGQSFPVVTTRNFPCYVSEDTAKLPFNWSKGIVFPFAPAANNQVRRVITVTQEALSLPVSSKGQIQEERQDS
ncbi:hypothetical protein BTVI_124216 [Pitangus sulphuratus]|nr:hypothetical protein BTVI_124216 [Pitangus sulphuratus]